MSDTSFTTRLASRLPNGFMNILLISPLHRIASRTVMVLYFTGRSSGRAISTPISYFRVGNRLTCFTGEPWWKNLEGGAPVRVLIQRKLYEGWAEPCPDDKQAVAEGLARFLTHVTDDARFYGVSLDEQGQPDRQHVAAAAQRMVMIQIQMKDR